MRIFQTPRRFRPLPGLALLLALGTSATVSLTASATVRPCLAIEERTDSKRPARHPDFNEAIILILLGKKELSEEQWLEIADLMCKAEEDWPEDGRRVRPYDRRFVPYLPRYHLSVALYEVGCYKAAQVLLERSVLKESKEKRLEYDDFVEKLESSTDKVRRGEWQREGADCSDWQDPKAEPQSSDE